MEKWKLDAMDMLGVNRWDMVHDAIRSVLQDTADRVKIVGGELRSRQIVAGIIACTRLVIAESERKSMAGGAR